MREFRGKLKEINQRPIRKVASAAILLTAFVSKSATFDRFYWPPWCRNPLSPSNFQKAKKVAEAQGRKKKRAVQRLEKLRKQANTLANNEDISAQGKVRWRRLLGEN